VNDSLSGIARLERDVLDESVALSSLLRQVLILGGRASSEALRDWALCELKGYADAIDRLPAYRIIPAQIKVNTISGPAQFIGQEISARHLPEPARGIVKEEVGLPWGVGEVQATIRSNKSEHIRLGMPGMAQLAHLLTEDQRERQGNPFLVVTSVYWAVSVAAMEGLLDQVRTQLAEFVAELRANMQPGEVEPTSDQIREAVSTIQITVGDNSPVTVTAPIAYAAEQDANASASVGDLLLPKELPSS
jgi:hypothetical protein